MKQNSGKAFLILLILGLAIFAFEVFNFDTTRAALTDIFGTREAILTLSIASWLALGACGLDVGGMVRVFTEEVSFKREAREIKLITGAWIVASLFNAFFTFWVTIGALESPGATIPRYLAGTEVYIALGVSLFVWLVRLLLVGGFAEIADKTIKIKAPNLKLGRKNKSRGNFMDFGGEPPSPTAFRASIKPPGK